MFLIAKFLSLSRCLAPKPSVRNNYHAHRLSLWLNLIPRLHASGALDNKLHLMNSPDHHLGKSDDRTGDRNLASEYYTRLAFRPLLRQPVMSLNGAARRPPERTPMFMAFKIINVCPSKTFLSYFLVCSQLTQLRVWIERERESQWACIF